MSTRTKATRLTAATVALAAALGLSACGGADADSASTTLSLVGFAVPKAGNNAAQKEFAKTDDGEGVVWKESYGASGDQSRAVAGGLKADYVHFSITPDVTRLVEAGLVDETWDDGEHKGIVTDSVVVFVVREGNPKNIQTWDDLIKPGVAIVTPNPGSSGAARWNILAGWQQAAADGGDAAGTDYLTGFFKNVAALPGSGRDATAAFQAGTGDVLISYENEAILARQQGEKFDYVVPDETLLIENPGAVVKDADPAAEKFLDFVLSDDGQEQYVLKGFRPISDTVEVGTVEGANDPEDPFPTPSKLYTIDGDLGGWEAINAKFFDEDKGIVTKIQQDTGKS